jgi:phytoene dehydrogenase-like protein
MTHERLPSSDYDAIVIGSGPNGLSAAIVLQQAGLSVLILEGKATVGGGLRTGEITLPGYRHDLCSAILPFAVESPFLNSLPLHLHGLEYIYPTLAAAHPFEDGTAAILDHSIERTADSLRTDGLAYRGLMNPLKENWPEILRFVMNPIHFPSRPLALTRFCYHSLLPASTLIRKYFRSEQARGLFAGMAAHAVQPLDHWATSAAALVLMLMGHDKGWPMVKGGTGQLAGALASYFTSLGGRIETNFPVRSLEQLPSSRALLLDVTPRQLLQIAGHRLSGIYRWQMERFRYGMGVFKIDWALDGPIPFTARECTQAGTIHLGNRFEEIASGEQESAEGKITETPYVLLVQQSLFDPGRAPEGRQTAWAYCHTPRGSVEDRTKAIESQVERFAPGFRDRILARHTMNCMEMENYNPNYVGGDIGGGVQDIRQMFTRPALRFSPYRSAAKGIYLCSSSTPPGGGVHGMCGFHAAKKVLKDIFRL